jgi:AraC family transcriptional regulator
MILDFHVTVDLKSAVLVEATCSDVVGEDKKAHQREAFIPGPLPSGTALSLLTRNFLKSITVMDYELEMIRSLVGPVEGDQLRYVDSFVSDDVGLFMPVGGACFYALTPEHSHPSYMFVLHFDDRTAIKINGEVMYGMPGTLFGLAPDVEHQELPTDVPPRYIAILIKPELFNEQLSHYGDGNSDVSGRFFDPGPELLKLLNRFMIEADNRLPGSQAVLRGIGVEICHSIIRCMVDLEPVRDRISARIEIDRVIKYLHAHIDSKITVDVMAQIACMSPSHFARTFREEVGLPPAQYLLEVRLQRAKKLLKAGDRLVTEIALECGFGSTAYLSTQFNRRFKISPSDFRRTSG